MKLENGVYTQESKEHPGFWEVFVPSRENPKFFQSRGDAENFARYMDEREGHLNVGLAGTQVGDEIMTVWGKGKDAQCKVTVTEILYNAKGNPHLYLVIEEYRGAKVTNSFRPNGIDTEWSINYARILKEGE